MRVLFDTNILVDFLFDRKPYSDPAAHLLSLVETKNIAGVLCATTITTLYYLHSKSYGTLEARKRLRIFLSLFEIAPVDHAVLLTALDIETPDYEDAVICESARKTGCDFVVTRDPHDFAHSPIPIVSPVELIDALLGKRD